MKKKKKTWVTRKRKRYPVIGQRHIMKMGYNFGKVTIRINFDSRNQFPSPPKYYENCVGEATFLVFFILSIFLLLCKKKKKNFGVTNLSFMSACLSLVQNTPFNCTYKLYHLLITQFIILFLRY
jgi:hypothetical protein